MFLKINFFLIFLESKIIGINLFKNRENSLSLFLFFPNLTKINIINFKNKFIFLNRSPTFSTDFLSQQRYLGTPTMANFPPLIPLPPPLPSLPPPNIRLEEVNN